MSEQFDQIAAAMEIGGLKHEVASMPKNLRPIGEKIVELTEIMLRMKLDHIAEVDALKAEIAELRAARRATPGTGEGE